MRLQSRGRKGEGTTKKLTDVIPQKPEDRLFWFVNIGLRIWSLRMYMLLVGFLVSAMMSINWMAVTAWVQSTARTMASSLGPVKAASDTKTAPSTPAQWVEGLYYNEVQYNGDISLWNTIHNRRKPFVVRNALKKRSRSEVMALLEGERAKIVGHNITVQIDYAENSRYYYWKLGDSDWMDVPNIMDHLPREANYSFDDLKVVEKLYHAGESHYARYNILNPWESPALTEIHAPLSGAFQALAEKTGSLSFRYWLSSSEARAGAHFDLEDNFFFQLSGSKTFHLAPPSAWPLLKPFTYSHPSYRQANYPQEIHVPEQPTCSEKDQEQEQGHDGACKNAEEVYNPWNLFKVTLQSGDALFMPPYLFHEAFSHEGSISSNFWMGSEEYTVMGGLRRLGLPFVALSKSETMAHKSAMLAGLHHRLFSLIWRMAKEDPKDDGVWFLEKLTERYYHLPGLRPGDTCPPVEDKYALCTEGVSRHHVDNRRVKKMAIDAAMILAKMPRTNRDLSWADYVEQSANVLMVDVDNTEEQSTASPCRTFEFYRECLIKPRPEVVQWLS